MEIWKEVEGTEGCYFVSNYGNIKNQKRILKQSPTIRGYLSVKVFQGRKSSHRLVAIAFIPNPDNKEQVNHKDGNKQNNHVDNLEWMTGTENQRHSWETGLRKKRFGEQSPRSKVSDATRKEIADKHASGATIISLAKEYDFTSTNIIRIVKKLGTHRPNAAKFQGEELRAHKWKILRDWYRKTKMTTAPRPYRIARENER